MEKELDSNIINISKENIDPRIVWGSKKRIIEIIGQGSGRGFELKNANLPERWEDSIDRSRQIDLGRLALNNSEICEKWGYNLEAIDFDQNGVLRTMSIKNCDGKDVSTLELSSSGHQRETEKGIYVTNNIDSIEAAIVTQEILSRYLGFLSDDDFKYGYIGSSSSVVMGGGFGPVGLEIPKDIFRRDEEITGEGYQTHLYEQAINIAGRFGIQLEGVDFDDRGALRSVSVEGDRVYYGLGDSGRRSNKYESHNVDNAYQAAVLHGIVALYINFLLDKEQRRSL